MEQKKATARAQLNRSERKVIRILSREDRPLKRVEIIERSKLSGSTVDQCLSKLEHTKLAKKVKPEVFYLTEIGKKGCQRMGACAREET